MIIINKQPLTLAQVEEYVSKQENAKATNDYLKEFNKRSREESEKLAAEIRALNNMKIKEESIIKIVDLSPQDSEDINKIFTEVSLSEEEINAILSITKKY